MASRDKITYDQFIEAVEIIAVVIADGTWRRFRDETQPVKRPASDSDWLDSKAARRHVCFGETKFRELVKEGVLPAGRKVGGKLIWDKRELDRSMAIYVRGGKRTPNCVY